MHALIYMLAFALAFSLSLAAHYLPEEPLSKSVSHREQTDDGATWYKTESFYAPDLQVTKTNKTAPGLLFFTPYGAASTTNVSITNSSVIMTDAGELVWMRPVPNYYSDLRTQSHNNQTYLTFWNSSIGGPDRGNGCGSVDFLDHSLNLAHRVCLADLNIVTPTGTKWPCQVDPHEAQMANRNTLLVTVYNVTQADLRSVNGSENSWIFDSQFYEVDPSTEEILFSWKLSDHLDQLSFDQSHYPVNFPTYSLGVIQADPWDAFHINSIQGLDDGYLISSRHYWTIYKIFRNGTIDWQWQGAKGDCHDICSLPPATHFSWQHHVRVNSTSPDQYLQLAMFENANSEVDSGTAPSLGTTYYLDTVHKTALLNDHNPNTQLFDPHNPVFADSQGSHQLLPNGNTLLGYGQVGKIKEFDPAGTVLYTAAFGHPDRTISLRTFKLNGRQAVPSYPPKLYAQIPFATADLDVWISWNGATDIDAWTILAGDWNDTAAMRPIATPNKDGFETRVHLASVSGTAFVPVEALRGGDRRGPVGGHPVHPGGAGVKASARARTCRRDTT